MASVHKNRGRPTWYAAYTTPDGVRHLRSTGTCDRKQALVIAQGFEEAARQGYNGKLTPQSAREIVDRTVRNIFMASNGEAMPSTTLRDWCDQWVKSKEVLVGRSSFLRYGRIVKSLVEFLGEKSDRDICLVTAREISAYRDSIAKRLSQASVNIAVKLIRSCLGAAVKEGYLNSNPAANVATIRIRGPSKRRGFSVEELGKVLTACGQSEFRGLVIAALYTGQRLGDVSRLTWRNVDLHAGEISLNTRKTGRRQIIPIAPPLLVHLKALPAPKGNLDRPIFPESARSSISSLSQRFRTILVSAGLAKPQTHAKTKDGRDGPRQVSELSFHSLRFSATSLLKVTGSSNAVAQEIVGHDSRACSEHYTSINISVLREAVERLPDVTAVKEESPSPSLTSV